MGILFTRDGNGSEIKEILFSEGLINASPSVLEGWNKDCSI